MTETQSTSESQLFCSACPSGHGLIVEQESRDTRWPAWIVDLDGTLYRSRPVKLAMAAELLTAGPMTWRTVSRFRENHEELRRNSADVSHSAYSLFDLQIEMTARQVRRGLQDVRETIQEWIIERPLRWIRRFRRDDLIHAIRQHRNAGGIIAVVSDYPAQRKLQALAVESLLGHVVANGEYQPFIRLKPAPDGVLAASHLLGVSPHECLVIGDRDDADGQAASAAGMSFSDIHDGVPQVESRKTSRFPSLLSRSQERR